MIFTALSFVRLIHGLFFIFLYKEEMLVRLYVYPVFYHVLFRLECIADVMPLTVTYYIYLGLPL